MSDAEDRDPQQELQSQRYRLASLQQQLDALRIHVTAWPAALLCLVAIIVPVYEERSDDPADATDSISLIQLPGEAAEDDNGVIQAAAIILCLLLAAMLLASIVAAFNRNGLVALATMFAASASILVWLFLLYAVGSSEGGGVIDELDYENTARILIAPVASVMAIVAGRTVRSITR